MKIGYIVDNLDYKNGGGRFCRDLISQIKLALPDCEQKILVKSSSAPSENSLVLGVSKLGIIRRALRLRSFIRDCDIIHAFDGMPYGLLAALLTLGLRRKFIITVIGSGSIKLLQSFWLRLILSWVYKRAAKIIAISSYTAREIQKKVPQLNIEVITPGIDLSHFRSLAAEIAAGANEFTNLAPYILSVGRLKPRKGYLQSLRVFALLRQQFPLLKYVIVGSGEGEYWDKMQEFIADNHLTEAVVILRNISDQDLVKLYTAAELFILLPQNDNYDIEGFGLVYVEAASFGLPVIGARDSGAEDALRDGYNGALVSPNDTSEAATAAAKILANPQDRERLRQNARHFSQEMDWPVIREDYVRIYRQLTK